MTLRLRMQVCAYLLCVCLECGLPGVASQQWARPQHYLSPYATTAQHAMIVHSDGSNHCLDCCQPGFSLGM